MSASPKVLYRIAVAADAGDLAHVVERAFTGDNLGGISRMGPIFVREYLRVVLAERHALALCAEIDGRIVGLHLATLDAAAEARALKRHKVRLGLAALRSALLRPNAIWGAFRRYRSLRHTGDGDSSESYVATSGARASYWAAIPGECPPDVSLSLLKKTLVIAKELGVRTLHFEVNASNTKVVRIHRMMGAVIVASRRTPDGLERHVCEYRF